MQQSISDSIAEIESIIITFYKYSPLDIYSYFYISSHVNTEREVAHSQLKHIFEENLTSDKLNEFQKIMMNPNTQAYTAIFVTNSICQMLKKFKFFLFFQITIFICSNWTFFSHENKDIIYKMLLETLVIYLFLLFIQFFLSVEKPNLISKMKKANSCLFII